MLGPAVAELQAECRSERLRHGLAVEEIEAAAVKQRDCKSLALLGQLGRVLLCAVIGLCNLKESAGVVAAADVADHCVDHRRRENRAHDREILGNRVENADGLSAGIVLRQTDQVKILRRIERIMHRLIEPLRGQNAL